MNLCKNCEILVGEIIFIRRVAGTCDCCGKEILNQNKPMEKTLKPMEKTLKMSVETAREIYKDYNFCIQIKAEISLGLLSMYKMVMENFTKEELESKKGFTWEESFNGEGYVFPVGKNKVTKCKISILNEDIVDVFKTEKQALSVLAFSKLSYIVAKYNEGKVQDKKWCYYTILKSSIGLHVEEVNHLTGIHLEFNTKEDAETSLKFNHDLWIQYWML